MADGNHAVARFDAGDLPLGWAVTASGRLSGVTDSDQRSMRYPFPKMDLVELDESLTVATRQSRARFAVYIGDLGADTAARARESLADVPTPDNAVLLAVSPNQRSIEVVYGADVRGRGVESAGPRGVSAAASSFKEGNLIGGLIGAVRVMAAGIARR
ncbi:MAG: DUF5130 family protein [Mycobacterium sp.]